MKAKVQKLVDAGTTSFPVARWPAAAIRPLKVVKTLEVDYTVDGKPHKVSGKDPDTIDLVPGTIAGASRPATLSGAADGGVLLEAWQNGRFELTTASGRKLAATVQDLPPVQTVAGPWQVKFPTGSARAEAAHP